MGLRARAWIVPALAWALLAVLALGLGRRDARITASNTTAQYTFLFLAENLVDGSTETYWIPDETPSHVDVHFRSPRTFAWVEVVNGDNLPHRSAATRALRVELFDGERRVWTADGEFTRIATDVLRFEPRARGDRLRVIALSHFASLPCLSELRWGVE
ncbi:MAG: hypothetical protein U0234_30440 [Sandaracinus sp.]